MSYTPTDWTTAKITPENLNHMQEQYQKAIDDASDIRYSPTQEIRCEVVSDFPAHHPGRIIFHTGMKMFFFSNGSQWLVNPQDAFLGNGQFGDFTSVDDVTFNVSTGDVAVRNYKSFTLNENDTLSVNNPCRCLIIRTWGDITINGTVDLDGKGGYGDRYITIGGTEYDLLGGLGGSGGENPSGEGGDEDSGQRCAGGMRGGGGGGGANGSGSRGLGGNKNTRFDDPNTTHVATGASLGDSLGDTWEEDAEDGINGGGGGGGATAVLMNDDYIVEAGPGRGNIHAAAGGGGGGIHVRDSQGNFYSDGGERPDQYKAGGGVLVLLSGGDVIINGQIRARGSSGGAGGDAYALGWYAIGGGGGGGSGGGRIIVIRRGDYTMTGETLLDGGSGGAGGSGMDDGSTASQYDGEDGSAGQSGNLDSYQI